MENSQCCTDSQKKDEQILSHYRPVWLLPARSKIFESLESVSGCRTGHSRINQLLSITYGIFHSFDEKNGTRAIFL